MIKKEFSFLGGDGCTKIYGMCYLPDNEIKGYIQVVHDFYDHIGRYDSIMNAFAYAGYACFGIDLVGHGKSIVNEDALGVIPRETTQQNLIDDLNVAYKKILLDYNDYSEAIGIKGKDGRTYQFVKPVIHTMIGIGLGVALIREYCSKYRDVNSLVLIGDPGFTNQTQKALSLTTKSIKLGNQDASAKQIRDFIQGKYNDYIEDKNKYRNSYRSTVIEEVKKTNQDKLCSFEYDLKTMEKLLSVETMFSLSAWVNTFNKYMPLYELSGYQDPVTNYSREIDSIITHFKYSNCKNVFYKYYDKNRHEILFDKCKSIVMNDILNFIENIHKQFEETYQEEKSRIGG